MTKTVIFLNRWNNLFHLMLTSVGGEDSRRLDSRYATSLEQARKAVAYWQTEFNVAAEDVHDNSMVDLDDIFSWMDVDRVTPFMDTNLLDTKFARIGARLKVADRPSRRTRTAGVISLDVQADRKGEFFEIVRQPGSEAEVAVLDVQPADRHLLLLVREGKDKSKFLCGHDERHWFVAGIPESAPVGTVRQAKEALKPAEVQTAQARQRLKGKARNRRKNAAFVRQGEWFFLPVPGFVVDERLVLPNEPLRRGNGGKPHWAEFCYRTGGETVYVCSKHPNGVTEAQYKGILAGSPKAKGWGWRTMRRNPGVYVKGRVRHADHATITLNGWHQVVMNAEGQSKAMRNVAFLD